MITRQAVHVVLVLGAIFVMGLAGADETSYVGATRCKMCHIRQFQSWETTAMAQSFDVLRPGVRTAAKTAAGLDPEADYTHAAECLRCHTTGYGKPGGFVSIEETPTLADIIAAGLVLPTAETCTALCHNESSPFHDAASPFDFEARKNEGTHDHITLKYPH